MAEPSSQVQSTPRQGAPSETTRVVERDVLQILDTAKFQSFHYKAIAIVGFGWFVVGWQTALSSSMLSILPHTRISEGLTHAKMQALTAVLLLSSLVGSLVMGVMADMYGRKRTYLFNTAFLIVGAGLSAVATWGSGTTVVILWGLWRILLGFALGGEFPITAALSAEIATKRWRGAIMGFTYAMFGCGTLSFQLAGVIVVRCFKDDLLKCDGSKPCDTLDIVWRILMAASVVPAAVVLFFRDELPETPRWTLFVQQNITKASEDSWKAIKSKPTAEGMLTGPGLAQSSWADWRAFLQYIRMPRVAKQLALFSLCAMLSAMSIATFNTVAEKTVIRGAFHMHHSLQPGFVRGHTYYDYYYYKFAAWTATLSIICIMGHCGGWALIDIMGRKVNQCTGFAVQGACLLVLAALCQGFTHCGDLHHTHVWPGILTLVASIATSFGPSITTFVWPAELFATRFRGRVMGIVAAVQVFGSIVVVLMMDTWWQRYGEMGMLNMMGAAAALGAVVTLSLPEAKGRSLEELSGELSTKYTGPRQSGANPPGEVLLSHSDSTLSWELRAAEQVRSGHKRSGSGSQAGSQATTQRPVEEASEVYSDVHSDSGKSADSRGTRA